jgi:hypothetical protein
MLWFFFLFIWIVILFHILTDLFRDHTLSGGMKTLWVVFLPFLAVLVYLICRGKGCPSGPRPVSSRPRSSSKATSGRSPPVTPPPPRPTRSPRPSNCWTPAPSTRPSSTA